MTSATDTDARVPVVPPTYPPAGQRGAGIRVGHGDDDDHCGSGGGGNARARDGGAPRAGAPSVRRERRATGGRLRRASQQPGPPCDQVRRRACRWPPCPCPDPGHIPLCSRARDNASRGKREWILPKGGWERDESKEQSAEREAWEEGGVRGQVGRHLLTTSLRQRLTPTTVHYFEMAVSEEAAAWPEHETRLRRWVRPGSTYASPSSTDPGAPAAGTRGGGCARPQAARDESRARCRPWESSQPRHRPRVSTRKHA
jgi:8-oxo-dGTP pyrophosphatase MutT (NUDIX family)